MSGPKFRNKNGKCERDDGKIDGRSRKQKNREKPYYVRLNEEWFELLEGLLDLPDQEHTACPGCVSRADLLQTVFGTYLNIRNAAKALNHTNVDDFVEHVTALATLLDDGASKLNYRDRYDLAVDAISSLEFLMKKAPLPAFARVEDTPLLAPLAKSDQPKLL